jgi:adenylylsulfate kinase
LSADLKTCEDRDPKGLYKKARLGEIKDFTGIDSPYEVPEKPDLIVDTKKLNIDDSVEKLFHYIVKKIPIS